MNSERTAQLQVALASYDLKELRVQKRYLQEQGTAIDCTCFCSGEKLWHSCGRVSVMMPWCFAAS